MLEFFDVFGVDTVTQATFEHRVKFSDGLQGFVDCFWPDTILVEMKLKGKDLDAAFGQAMDYVRTMCDGGASVGSRVPRDRGGAGRAALPLAIVVSDFQTFRFYDLTKDALPRVPPRPSKTIVKTTKEKTHDYVGTRFGIVVRRCALRRPFRRG